MEQDMLLCLGASGIHDFRQIDTAFPWLEDSTHGRCEECGNEILVGRLELLPVARLCVDCQRKRECHSHTVALAGVRLIISASVEEAEPNGLTGRGMRGGCLARNDISGRPGRRFKNANAQRRDATAPNHLADH